ncbi:hypothetical protein PM082_017260 [Marasmius tenuissimus]|nr:hypothetical protein PM082_017260 [Marasmius tenuissimus]
MHFNFIAIVAVFFSVLRLAVASPIPESLHLRGELIVYRPRIIQASIGARWQRGQTRTVSWDTSDLPQEKENATGTLLLGFLEARDENLDIDHPLADNFPLKKGSVAFTVPKHLERKKGYIIALLGDSGNISGPFAVV